MAKKKVNLQFLFSVLVKNLMISPIVLHLQTSEGSLSRISIQCSVLRILTAKVNCVEKKIDVPRNSLPSTFRFYAKFL